ncbi:MAG TPA: hypothetical protein VMU34_08840 [Mycobacterium sp.]|nr:hypothetical protein [Mycobacterium sp.]
MFEDDQLRLRRHDLDVVVVKDQDVVSASGAHVSFVANEVDQILSQMTQIDSSQLRDSHPLLLVLVAKPDVSR